MKKSVLLMAGLMAMAFTGSALAAGAPMFAVQNSSAADKFVVQDDGSVVTSPIGFNYDGTTGMAGFGTAAPVAALSVTASTAAATRGIMNSQHGNNAAAANMNFRKSRGTEATPTIVINGDYTGSFAFRNYDGTAYLSTAFFGARVSGTVATGSVPTDMFFCTAAAGTTDCYGTGNVKMLISSAGNVGVGTVTPTSKLQVVGLPVFADNAAATAGGLTAGAFYRTATGVLMVAF